MFALGPAAAVALTLVLILAGGCSTDVRRRDWSSYTGPGAQYFHKEEYKLPLVPDPFEPANRLMWRLNDFVLFDLIEPVSAAWRFIVPQTVRTHLVNAADNVAFPVRAVNCLLQGRLDGARRETERFLINTTVGVLGLFDKASEMGIEPAREDLGRTLAKWGWTDSPYLFLPIAGPSTVRDAVGQGGDLYLDPASYYLPAALATRFVIGSEYITEAKRQIRSSLDAYGPLRYGWVISRWLSDVEFAPTPGHGAAVDTFDAVLFTNQDPWFPAEARTGRVRIESTGRYLPYDVWVQPTPAPMVFVVPGFGAHRRGGNAVGLAEMFHDHGCSVVVISSAMNFEFMQRASTVPVPGYAPVDASDVHAALDAISRDLDRRFGARITGRLFVGLSLGAFHGLYIASGCTQAPLDARTGLPVTATGDLITAGRSPSRALVDFDGFILLHPPISMRRAVQRLDAYYNAPLRFPESQRDERVWSALRRMIIGLGDLQSGRIQRGRAHLPRFSDTEAEFLIGLGFRLYLHDVIWCSQTRKDMGVLQTPRHALARAAASDEVLDYSFMEYLYAFVLPFYHSRHADGLTPEQMFDRMEARSLADLLPRDGRLRVFTSANDFLLSESDVRWLIDTFGQSNIVVEPTGGHAGALVRPEFRGRILDALDAVRERSAPR